MEKNVRRIFQDTEPETEDINRKEKNVKVIMKRRWREREKWREKMTLNSLQAVMGNQLTMHSNKTMEVEVEDLLRKFVTMMIAIPITIKIFVKK